jgi:hypothetical protein
MYGHERDARTVRNGGINGHDGSNGWFTTIFWTHVCWHESVS